MWDWAKHFDACTVCDGESLCPEAASVYRAEVDALDREMGYDPSEND